MLRQPGDENGKEVLVSKQTVHSTLRRYGHFITQQIKRTRKAGEEDMLREHELETASSGTNWNLPGNMR